MSTTVPIPTVHMNGTGRKELQAQLQEAYTAVKQAEKALQAAAPHGRDYYPQGPDAYTAAADAHCSRMLRLEDIADELQAIYEGIAS